MFVVLQKCVSHCFCFATVDGHVSAKQGVFKLAVCSCCFKRKTRSFIWRCCFCTVKIRLGGLRRLILLKIKFKPHASARHVRVITSDLTVVRRNLLSSPTPPLICRFNPSKGHWQAPTLQTVDLPPIDLCCAFQQRKSTASVSPLEQLPPHERGLVVKLYTACKTSDMQSFNDTITGFAADRENDSTHASEVFTLFLTGFDVFLKSQLSNQIKNLYLPPNLRGNPPWGLAAIFAKMTCGCGGHVCVAWTFNTHLSRGSSLGRRLVSRQTDAHWWRKQPRFASVAPRVRVRMKRVRVRKKRMRGGHR